MDEVIRFEKRAAEEEIARVCRDLLAMKEIRTDASEQLAETILVYLAASKQAGLPLSSRAGGVEVVCDLVRTAARDGKDDTELVKRLATEVLELLEDPPGGGLS